VRSNARRASRLAGGGRIALAALPFVMLAAGFLALRGDIRDADARFQVVLRTSGRFTLDTATGEISDVRYVLHGETYRVNLPCDWHARQVDNNLWAHGFMSLRWLHPLLDHHRRTGSGAAARTLAAYLSDFHRYHMVEDRPHDRYWLGDHTLAIRLRLLVDVRNHLTGKDPGFAARLDDMIATHLEMGVHHPRIARPDLIHNHQAMVNAALIYAALGAPDLDPDGEYLRTGEARFERQAEGIFTPSRVTREHSHAYHVYGLGVIYDCLDTYRRFAAAAPGFMGDLLAGGQEFLAYNLLPDGTMPGVGDSFVPYPTRILDRLARLPGGLDPRLASVLDGGVDLPARAVIWHDAGMAVLRPVADGEPAHLFFMASCFGRVHKHDDDLSFTLFGRGRRFIVDTAYDDAVCGGNDPDSVALKAYVRTATAHNVLLCPDQPWQRPGEPRTRITGQAGGDRYLAVQGEHDLIPGALVTRTILMIDRDVVLVHDRVRGPDARRYEQLFHLDPGLGAEPIARGFVCRDEAGTFTGVVAALGDEDVALRIGEGRSDDPPGFVLRNKRLVPSRTLAFAHAAADTAVFGTLLTLSGDERPLLPHVHVFDCDGAGRLEAVMTLGDETLEIHTTLTPPTGASPLRIMH